MRLKANKKGKGKKLKKGQSSSSNPELKKHRLAAKSRFFSQNTGPSSLTTDALAKHDAALQDSEGDVPMSESDAQTVSAKTFSTWATNWTDCTNATFNRVHRYWASNSALHKEILAVLAAVTEVIKQKGGTETETEYFAALMTSLETVDGEQSLSAIAYLLSIVIKRVPNSVLKNRFSDISKAFLTLMANHSTGDSPALLKSLIMCVAVLLRVQDQGAWNSSATSQVYHSLLAFVTHPKPKVRKSAHQAVCLVLKGSLFMSQGEPPPNHPAASMTAKYCIQQIEQCGGSGDVNTTLHILGLLKDILGLFPHNSLKSTCEAILRVMTLSNVLVKSLSLQALHGMFNQEPKASSLPAELNAQLITAMYDYQPGEKDSQQMAAWLAVMEKAHQNLVRLDEKLCSGHLPRLFSSCMTCLQSSRSEVCQAAAKTLTTLLKDCVSRMVDRLEAELSVAPKPGATSVFKMFHSVEGGLSYQYHASWGLVLNIIKTFFEVAGKKCHSIMKKCLLSMADLHDSQQFAYTGELDQAVGMAVCVMGPKTVLQAIPLHITGDEDNYDFPRSWLLPVLRDNIKRTELNFFTSYFLPLAVRLRRKSIEYSKQDRVVESKTYDALQLQIWSLLPGFCTNPTDLKMSFKGIAKILGSAITEREDLRPIVMASIRKLILQNLEHDENRKELSRFAKNFHPIFFNLFTETPEKKQDKSHLAVLETIKCYMQITGTQLIYGFFDKCLDKLSESDITASRRRGLLDLVLSMVPYLDSGRIKSTYSAVVSQLESSDKTVQKKSYRILEEICSCKSAACKKFVESHLDQLQTILLQALAKSAASSKTPRLKCLVHIFKHLEGDHMKFLLAVIPEAILCTKEVAERSRAAAYLLLVEMARAATRWSNKPVPDSLCEYMQSVMAGLAGTPHLVAATLLALTRLIYEFKELISPELLRLILENSCLLLRSKSREIVQPTLGLLKVLLRVFPDVSLAQYLKDLVSSLVSMKEDNKHHFRFKAKEIFARLIRKFGFKLISDLVPVSHKKILTNIRKTQERAKRKRKENIDESEDDDDEEEFKVKSQPQSIEDILRDTDSEIEDDDNKSKKSTRKVKRVEKKAWLQEGETEIMDFMDAEVNKKILATNPEEKGKAGKSGVKHDFKMAADGRMIITAGEEDVKKQNKDKGNLPADVDDLDELIEAMDHYSKKSRKRKHDPADDLGDSGSVMTYKSGGTGIHRSIGGTSIKQKERDFGSEYRAKKAKGDIKKKGKPDPYAYVPLQMSSLNKRKKAKLQGQFKGLVKGARKGAVKGKKHRIKKK